MQNKFISYSVQLIYFCKWSHVLSRLLDLLLEALHRGEQPDYTLVSCPITILDQAGQILQTS
jgi:hypothetical protein